MANDSNSLLNKVIPGIFRKNKHIVQKNGNSNKIIENNNIINNNSNSNSNNINKFNEDINDLDILLDNAKKCEKDLKKYTIEKIENIIRAIYLKGMEHSEELANMAVEETGIGVAKHKIIKNQFSSKYIYEHISGIKTMGVISEDPVSGITQIAEPVGTVLAIIPATNPTSTVLFKTLISLKTRNPIIISPPKRAKKTCSYLVDIIYKEAIKAGAPKNCIQCVEEPNRDRINYLMRDKRIGMILATGGTSLVNAAYSSGNPAIGVGPGNTPVYIDKNYNIDNAVKDIVLSKTFDNGTICASEQSIVVEEDIYEEVINCLENNNSYIIPDEELAKIEKVVYDDERKGMSPDIVGKSAKYIAEKANIEIPENTKMLVAKQKHVGKDYPLSGEILAPIIALYNVKNFEEALNLCEKLVDNGGRGHTASIFSDDDEKILEYGKRMEVTRTIVNAPSSLAAIGGLYNELPPSLTLGCGTMGNNIMSENISVKHLINIKYIAKTIYRPELEL